MILQIQNKVRNGGIGTAAAIVCFADKPDELYLLSASHVLAPTQQAAVGDAIVAVTAAGPFAVGATIATLWDWTGLIDGAGYPNLADAAIAKIVKGFDPATHFPDLAKLTLAKSRPSAGAPLTSLAPSGVSGPIRNASEDRVITWKDTSSAGIWDYGMADHIVGGFAVSGGDSGAPVLNVDGEIVGIVSGAPLPDDTDAGPSTVISPIDNIIGHAQWAPRTLVSYAERNATVTATTPVPATPEAFIAAHKADALNVKQKYQIPASVCLAQSALETGWGKSVVGNAFFGIKGTGGSGPTVQFPTHENVNGHLVPTLGTFRAYKDFAEAADDYGKLLTTGAPYRNALAFRTDPEAFARAIAAAGYASAEDYAESLIAVLRSRNLLDLDRT